MKIKKKKEAVLITGGAKRLGLEFTKKSLEMGYSVVVHYRSSRRELLSWLKKNSHYKTKVEFIKAELNDGHHSLIKQAFSLPLKISGLVNNASIFSKGNIININQFTHILENNAITPLKLSESFFKRAKQGWIINITDAKISRMNRNYQNYRISKQFLSMLTKQMAFTMAPGFRVNAIAPGIIMPARNESRKYIEKTEKKVPLKNESRIDSVMSAYEYLVNSDYVTGQVLYADGGWNVL